MPPSCPAPAWRPAMSRRRKPRRSLRSDRSRTSPGCSPPAPLALAGERVVSTEPRPLAVDEGGRVDEDAGRGRVVDVVNDVDVVRAMERIVELVALSNRRGQ